MHTERRAAPWSTPWRVSSTDLVLAGCAAILGSISVHYRLEAARAAGESHGPAALVSYAMVVGLSATLVPRRVAPIASFLATVVVFWAIRLADVAEPTVSVVVLAGSYVSVGVHADRRWRTAARAAATVGFVVVYVVEAFRLVSSQDLDESIRSLLVLDVAFSVAIIGSAWFIGDVLRSRAELTDALRLRTEQLERERGRAERLAVADERLRIARELHDVLAHHVSVMGLQAVAAGRVLERSPVDARTALDVIERSSRAAVDEMRQLIGFLRADERDEPDEPDRRPQPSIADVHELVASARALGLDVELRHAGALRGLPAGVDLAVYRIVQEALTNVHKHSDATAATVAVERLDDRITVTVVDNGRTARESPRGSGMGIVGMRERVRLHEGSCEIGPAPGDGFRVSAIFPIRSPA